MIISYGETTPNEIVLIDILICDVIHIQNYRYSISKPKNLNIFYESFLVLNTKKEFTF